MQYPLSEIMDTHLPRGIFEIDAKVKPLINKSGNVFYTVEPNGIHLHHVHTGIKAHLATSHHCENGGHCGCGGKCK